MSSIRKLATIVLALAIPTCEAFAASCETTGLGHTPEDAAEFAAACTDTAVNAPYKFAWLLFAKICPLSSTDNDSEEPSYCAWQKWATNNQTFPIHPQPEDPPKWPASGEWPLDDGAKFEFTCDSLAKEVVFERRRNRPEFEYVVDNHLWYQEGLKEAYNKEDWQINFPQNAVNVAVEWKEIKEGDKSKYHWKKLPDGKTICGLTNLDVKSRILPKWFYFSFEHVDNPGRCDFSGCRDDFGQKPSFVPPIFKHPTHMYLPDQLNERPKYVPGTLTSALTDLIKIEGVWVYYRLKGVQTDFTTRDGKPTILAGSQIEGTAFPASSSCMTCHSQAGFNSNGQNLRGGGEVGDFLSPNGAPDPAWFYDMGPDVWQLRYKQSDFVWAIPINTCPVTCPSSQAELKLVPHRCNCGP